MHPRGETSEEVHMWSMAAHIYQSCIWYLGFGKPISSLDVVDSQLMSYPL